ncbi:hypothetical protein [Pseudomonas fluorescens]|nr:hypothetical protein [Pseudomonas fluorescens]
MDINEYASCLDALVVWTFFASKLAPTEIEYIREIRSVVRPPSLASQLLQRVGAHQLLFTTHQAER